MSGSLTVKPVSSENSRNAAAHASSPSWYSPLGIDQEPKSLFFQNGPPGWASSTSSTSDQRYINKPALFFAMSEFARYQRGMIKSKETRGKHLTRMSAPGL